MSIITLAELKELAKKPVTSGLKLLIDQISNKKENQTIVDSAQFKDTLASQNEIVSSNDMNNSPHS